MGFDFNHRIRDANHKILKTTRKKTSFGSNCIWQLNLLRGYDNSIYCDTEEDQIKNIKAPLLCFEAVSGLLVSFFNSELIGLWGWTMSSFIILQICYVGEQVNFWHPTWVFLCALVMLPNTYGSGRWLREWRWSWQVGKQENFLYEAHHPYSDYSNLPMYFMSIDAQCQLLTKYKNYRDYLWQGSWEKKNATW